MKVLWSVVTVAKVCLFFLNLYVLALVLVVVLGQWPLFNSQSPERNFDDSHLIVHRELNENDYPVKAVSINKNPTAVKVISTNLSDSKNSDPDANVMAERVRTLNYWCDKIRPQKPRLTDLMDVFKLKQILVDDKHKMLYCQIPEVAQTDWLKILVFLTGKVNVTNHLSISASDAHSKHSKHLKKLSDFSIKEREKRIRDYYKFLFVREPLERIVSVYKNKFSAKYSKYFHQAFGKKIIKKYRKKPSKASLQNGNDVTFPEFIQYLVDSDQEISQPLNEHWEQYYKHCHPCLIRYNFVGRFETLHRDMKHVLKKTSALHKLKPPLTSLQQTYTEGVLYSMYKPVSVTNLRKLWKIYYPDYNLFSYQYPKVLDKLLKLAKVFEDY